MRVCMRARICVCVCVCPHARHSVRLSAHIVTDLFKGIAFCTKNARILPKALQQSQFADELISPEGQINSPTDVNQMTSCVGD